MPYAFRIDWPLLAIFACLAGVSLALLTSIEAQYANIGARQMRHFVVGAVAFVLVSQIPPNGLRVLAPWLYVGLLAALIAVAVVGNTEKGAQRWLSLGPLNIQPSELGKVILPLMVAWWFSTAEDKGFSRMFTWLGMYALLIIPTGMIYMQPDLGTALILGMIAAIAIFFAGISWASIGLGALGAAIAAPILWLNMHAYQKARVLNFMDPYQDALNSGYHLIQSQIAIGSAGLSGKGFGAGSQSQLGFVPEQHTDFIFSVLAEEFGFIGIVALFALYAALLWRGATITYRATHLFSRLIGATFTFMLIISMAINIAMVIGLAPIVGITLPFVSYGGSSILTNAIALGMLVALKYEEHRAPYHDYRTTAA